MSSHSNPNVIPRDDCGGDDDDEDRPHDERLSRSSAMAKETSSLASQRTYGQKDPTPHRISAPKRSARREPPIESDSRSSKLPSSFTSSHPLLGDIGRVYNRREEEDNDNIQLLPPLPNDRIFRHQQPLPPISRPQPGFNNTASGIHLHGIFDDATEDTSRRLGHSQRWSSNHREPERRISPQEQTVGIPLDFFSNFMTSVSLTSEMTKFSSLTPEEGRPNQGIARVPSNMTTSDIGSTHGGNQTASSVNPRSGNPRSILNERYQKKFNRSFTKTDFVTIRDASDGDHIPMFTSMFVCPESGECFLSGNRLAADFVLDRVGMKWYKIKKDAEFAAAGRAEDSFRFRLGECSSGSGDRIEQFCAEPPYLINKEEQREILMFSNCRACDTNARDRVKALSKRREV